MGKSFLHRDDDAAAYRRMDLACFPLFNQNLDPICQTGGGLP